MVKINLQNITAINKSSGVSDFLYNNQNKLNLIVVTGASKKVTQEVSVRYKKSEIFFEEDLMIDILSNELVPKHELLSKSEEEEFYETYNVKKRNIPKILSEEPISKYFNAKPGNIFRIIRPSETTGFTHYYRLVVKGTFKKK